jgi:hypothetical protein
MSKKITLDGITYMHDYYWTPLTQPQKDVDTELRQVVD